MEKLKHKFSNEDGVTLVELLAAIILISIIVLSFTGFFTMAAKTNSRTNTVNEATFLAQEEIERVTNCSKNNYTVAQTLDEKPGNVQTSITKNEVDILYKVVVTVTEGGETRAKMETYLSFAETAESENP